MTCVKLLAMIGIGSGSGPATLKKLLAHVKKFHLKVAELNAWNIGQGEVERIHRVQGEEGAVQELVVHHQQVRQGCTRIQQEVLRWKSQI